MLTVFTNDDILEIILLNTCQKIDFNFQAKPTMTIGDIDYKITKPLFTKIFLYISKIYDVELMFDYMFHKNNKCKVHIDYNKGSHYATFWDNKGEVIRTTT